MRNVGRVVDCLDGNVRGSVCSLGGDGYVSDIDGGRSCLKYGVAGTGCGVPPRKPEAPPTGSGMKSAMYDGPHIKGGSMSGWDKLGAKLTHPGPEPIVDGMFIKAEGCFVACRSLTLDGYGLYKSRSVGFAFGFSFQVGWTSVPTKDQGDWSGQACGTVGVGACAMGGDTSDGSGWGGGALNFGIGEKWIQPGLNAGPLGGQWGKTEKIWGE